MIYSIEDILGNDNHPLCGEFESLSENEQDDIRKLIKIIEKLDMKVD